MNKRPLVRIDDDLYQIIKNMAAEDDRSIDKTVNRALRKVLVTPGKSWGDAKKDLLKNPELKAAYEAPDTDVSDLLKPTGISGAQYDSYEKKSEPTAQDTFMKGEDLQQAMEQPCCKNPNQPCKHWVWDTASGEGYRNILSGRFEEVE